MLTIYSDDHHLHHGAAELIDGTFKPCFEMPSRADMVLARAKAVNLGPIAAPREFGLDPVRRVHSEGFVRFLQNAWSDWTALGRSHDMLPMTWPVRRLRDVEPDTIDGKLGYYSFDALAGRGVGLKSALLSQTAMQLGPPERLCLARHLASGLRADQSIEPHPRRSVLSHGLIGKPSPELSGESP